jgi:Domain of unknown function (DUF4191)
MSTPAPEKKLGRIKQYTQTYSIAKKTDRFIGLWTLLWFVVGALVGGLIFWVLPPREASPFKTVVIVLGAIAIGGLLAVVIFSRRAQAAAFKQMDGKPGAAVAALSMLRRGWKTDQMVAFNKQQDLVHRVVGPPGIVLIGEGNPNRLRSLLTSERRKHERVASETAVHEIIVGHDEGQVPLPKLTRTVMKLPKSVKPAEITDILNRLKALDAARPTIPLPKGPMPTSMKGMRGNLRGR